MPIDILSTFQRKNGGNFPLLLNTDVGGGWMTVADNAARDAIESAIRVEGMHVWSVGAATLYRLDADLVTWVAVPFGGSSGGAFTDNGTNILPNNSGRGLLAAGDTATNTVTGLRAVALGGQNNAAAADDSVAAGDGALTGFPGELAHASGSFSVAGDAQSRRVLVRRDAVIGAGPFVLTLDGAEPAVAGNSLVMPDEVCWLVEAHVVALSDNAVEGANRVGFVARRFFLRGTGAATIEQAKVTEVSKIADDVGGSSIDLVVNAALGSVEVQVVAGEAAQNNQWVGVIDIVQMAALP